MGPETQSDWLENYSVSVVVGGSTSTSRSYRGPTTVKCAGDVLWSETGEEQAAIEGQSNFTNNGDDGS